MPVKVALKRSKKLCDDVIDDEMLMDLLTEILEEDVYSDDRDSWREIGYCIAALCEINDIPEAGKTYDLFS